MFEAGEDLDRAKQTVSFVRGSPQNAYRGSADPTLVGGALDS
jgi:hypothetical protein